MTWFKFFIVTLGFTFFASTGYAQNTSPVEAPNVLIERLSNELLDLIKTDPKLRSGDENEIMGIVDSKVMPYLNFRRMTAMAIGPKWREATDQQKDEVEESLKLMLIRTYSGALNKVTQDISIVMLPYKPVPDDKDTLVRTEVRIPGQTPVELSYRLRLENSGWMIYNVNVAGVWMVENYRSQFQPILNSSGIEGLIKALQERGK